MSCILFILTSNFVLVCNFVSHERCMQFVVSPCISIATSLVKVSITFVVTFVAVHLGIKHTARNGVW